MKLKHKIRYARKQPTLGDIRIIEKFAWFPVVPEHDKTIKIWWEKYRVVQTYNNYGRYHMYAQRIQWREHHAWGEDVVVAKDYKLDTRYLVLERRRIKEAMKKT